MHFQCNNHLTVAVQATCKLWLWQALVYKQIQVKGPGTATAEHQQHQDLNTRGLA
jgi:hypothetical protein